MANAQQKTRQQLDNALRGWAKSSFARTRAIVIRSLSKTGNVGFFRRVTGSTIADFRSNSRAENDGYVLGTNKPGLIAWQKGSSRRAFFVRPVRARALSWVDPETGIRRFSLGHNIPAWRFLPRKPVFLSAVIQATGFSLDVMRKEYSSAFDSLVGEAPRPRLEI